MRIDHRSAFAAAALAVALTLSAAHAETAVRIDPPATDGTAPGSGLETAVLAGGCFWGIQAVFEHVKGVTSATSGYSGGDVPNPGYELVSTGTTGHAESVKVVYDPSRITYGQLLKVFFSVAHDPTELDRQGPDVGTQYRSAVFYLNAEQERIADAYIRQLDQAGVYPHPIVTRVTPFKTFYDAEAYHQDYADKHPDNPYIVVNDAPKVANLKAELPALYTATPAHPQP